MECRADRENIQGLVKLCLTIYMDLYGLLTSTVYDHEATLVSANCANVKTVYNIQLIYRKHSLYSLENICIFYPSYICISLTVPSRISTISLTKTMLKRYKPSLTVTWTEPQSELVISKYQVEYRKSKDTQWIPGPILSRSMTFTNLPALTAGTEYDVRVRAESAVGVGNGSAVQTERTYKRK